MDPRHYGGVFVLQKADRSTVPLPAYIRYIVSEPDLPDGLVVMRLEGCSRENVRHMGLLGIEQAELFPFHSFLTYSMLHIEYAH